VKDCIMSTIMTVTLHNFNEKQNHAKDG